MEEKPAIVSNVVQSVKRSRSGGSCFSTDTEYESANTPDDPTVESTEELAVKDVASLLKEQYAIITGGKSKEGCPIITFPDFGNFGNLLDTEYQRLMVYLTSVPSMQEADMGFVLVIDRRNDKWNSVKNVLLKISIFFPGLIHVAYVLRPSGFLQKAISEVSSKIFKEEFKFRVVVCSCLEELHEYIEPNQLTSAFEGTLTYSHEEWIQQRLALEKFSNSTKEVSMALDNFTRILQLTEFPNDVEATQELLHSQGEEYSDLKEHILEAARHGETLLETIRGRPGGLSSDDEANNGNHSNSNHTDPLGHTTAVERLLVQLEETERTFDEFWHQHSSKLRQCLELRRFEQEFKNLQGKLDNALKIACDMTEVGDSVARVDSLIEELDNFDSTCAPDVVQAEELIASGHQLLATRHYCPLECVQPKCSELQRVCTLLRERLEIRRQTLEKCHHLQEQVDRANKWCASGVELLGSQRIEKCSTSPELAEQSLNELKNFLDSASQFSLNSPKEFRSLFQDSITPETKALVTQVVQRIEDVTTMCEKRMHNLKTLTLRPPRPVQTVNPEPGVPLQPPVGAPSLTNPHKQFRKAHTSPKIDIPGSGRPESIGSFDATSGSSPEDDASRVKRGHVLTELLETERVYVAELGSILKGYKQELLSANMQSLIPAALVGKADILFGNLEELLAFHGDIFLKDLENCIGNTELVALCFTQRRESFHRLYTFYCQNMARSEQLRETIGEKNLFFQACQLKLGHKLPLAAYLLKPVQRITKYQLLLKDLIRYSDEGKLCSQLQEALDSMLVVLKSVNDNMHQIAITGFWGELLEQGELLRQGSFSVWTESKKDRLRELRLKPMQRHIFLYQKSMLFCKRASKESYNKATYHFKRYLKMSQIGLTESVKGDPRKFEVWLQGRQEVHTIQASNITEKDAWVCDIKRVLLEQLNELKGEKIRQYSNCKPPHKPLRQTTSWDCQKQVSGDGMLGHSSHRQASVPETGGAIAEEESLEAGAWSSDYSISEDEDTSLEPYAVVGGCEVGGGVRWLALADYCAVGRGEVTMREGDAVELLKVGCAGWWYVKIPATQNEGWAPSAYLEPYNRKSSRSS